MSSVYSLNENLHSWEKNWKSSGNDPVETSAFKDLERAIARVACNTSIWTRGTV